jgi:hypothetical protein
VAEVLVAQKWRDNAELIEAVFDMHVWPRVKHRAACQVADVTYGKGTWWKGWWKVPPFGYDLVKHDIKIDGVDFRKLPEADGTFDVVAFDPDYVAPGGRKTSTITEFNERYGLDGEYESPAQLQEIMNDGLTECARVLRPQGLILMKCTDYISSGNPWLGEFESIKHGLSIGLRVHDKFVHVSSPRMQPKERTRKCHACDGVGHVGPATGADPREYGLSCAVCQGTGREPVRQHHARSNTSTLIVFRKPGRRSKP